MSRPLKIALVTDELGWHSSRLIESFTKRSCEVATLSLPQCHFNGAGGGLHLPGFEDALPDGVFVRGIPAGSLETVNFYLGVLHALQHLGVFVYNGAQMIERSVDKAMTSFLLAHAGVPTPPAWAFADWRQAGEIVARRVGEGGGKLVLKPVFGSQGRGLYLIDDWRRWLAVCRELDLETASRCAQPAARGKPANGAERVCYLQSFIEGGEACDWRVFVVGGEVVAAMKRTGSGWINNVACGAECAAAELDPEMESLAQRAVAELGLFYAGVDLLKDREGRLWVAEVNSIPAWKGLQGVAGVNISDCLTRHFLAVCGGG